MATKNAQSREYAVRALALSIKSKPCHKDTTMEQCREIAEMQLRKLEQLAALNREKRKEGVR